MNFSTADIKEAKALNVRFESDALIVELVDGRTLSVPVEWYPRLKHASDKERAYWTLIGGGTGIHWPEIDEDISIRGLIEGRASGENSESINRWLSARREAALGSS